MKRLASLLLFILLGCAKTTPLPVMSTNYPDGVYRGTYYDYSTEQLAVEFELKEQRFTDIRFTGMRYRDGDYFGEHATQAQQAIVQQYQAAAAYLLQKGAPSLLDLYKKPELIPDVDMVTGATLKTSAVVSAIYDGLSRMPYYTHTTVDGLPDVVLCDGMYRGFYYEGGIELAAYSFRLQQGRFTQLELRALRDAAGKDCSPESREYLLASECLAYLTEKPVSAVLSLEQAVAVETPADAQVVAQLRSAFFGGLSRAPYQSTVSDAQAFFETLLVADGTYRGHYYDGGVEQLSIQFEVDKGLLHNITLRANQSDPADSIPLERYQQACLQLEEQPMAKVKWLYGMSEGKFEAGKLTYAFADALARGLYKLPDAPMLPVTQRMEQAVHTGLFEDENRTIEVQLRLDGEMIQFATLASFQSSSPDAEIERRLIAEQLARLKQRPLEDINQIYYWEHTLALPLIDALWDAAAQ